MTRHGRTAYRARYRNGRAVIAFRSVGRRLACAAHGAAWLAIVPRQPGKETAFHELLTLYKHAPVLLARSPESGRRSTHFFAQLRLPIHEDRDRSAGTPHGRREQQPFPVGRDLKRERAVCRSRRKLKQRVFL